MTYLAASVATFLLVASLFLLIFSLPGTWVIIGLSGLWASFAPAGTFSWQFFLLLFFLATLGELIEFTAGYFGAKRFGGSTKGSIAGMIGAIAGAIIGAPFFFGLGALLGVFGGGYLACFLYEKSLGKSTEEAADAALGITLGRLGGFIVKVSIGIIMLWLIIPKVWAITH